MKLELQKGSRSRILAGLLFAIVGIFIIRLFYLQVIQHDYYVALANSEQVKLLTLPAKRGVIYALDGSTPVQLVLNQTVYKVIADPYTTTDDKKIVDVVRRIAGGNARANIESLLENKESRYAILATKVSRAQAEKIKEEGLAGIIFREQTQRVYPEGSLAAQTLGFVDFEGAGKYGIEGGLNDRLIGKEGLLKTVTDVSSIPLTIGDRNINRPAVDGENIVLSIDRNVQSHAEQALDAGLKRTGATQGSAIVMDPQTGKIIAMANLPTYSPAEFNKVQDGALFNNPIVSVPYEAASVIKTLTLSTGIEKGVIGLNSTYVNTDSITVDDRVISNATKGQTGTITFQHGFTWSLNTSTVTIAERLGDGQKVTRQARDTMYDFFVNKFGMGRFTGVEVSGEAAGTVVPPENVEGNAVRYSNMSFGQGMNVTMVQVASAFSSIVNGGQYYKPTVIAGKVDSSGTYIPNDNPEPIRRTISANTSEQMRIANQTSRALFDAKYDLKGFTIGGKTGTSQVIENGVYSQDESIGSYIGFGGDDTPRYVIMIQLSGKDKKLQGERDAMPVFTDISNWLLDYYKIQPKM